MHQHSLLPPHQLARLPLAAAAGRRSSRISASSLCVYGRRGQPRSRDPGEQLRADKVSLVAATARLKEEK